ncbi:MAG TPA: YbaK/EbsC family protein [Limnochordia bacterium]|nr:YbaK/EbsC family protein [Limnochordia bacterium]
MEPAPVRIAAELRAFGLQSPVLQLSAQLRSAAELAAPLGAEPDQVVQSCVAAVGHTPVLIMAGGDHQVAWPRLERRLQSPLVKASADDARRFSGCPAGFIAPIGWPEPPLAFMDERLLEFDYVYASAGAPGRLFGLPPLELARITSADIVDLIDG